MVSLERGVFICRIASIFLLQRLKGNMSGDARDFNNIETRAVIKVFFPPTRQGVEGNSRHSERIIKGSCTIVCHRQKMVAQFKRDYFSTCDARRPGRPKTVTTQEIIDQIRELILEDRRISAKSVAEQLDVSRERVGSIIHEHLDMGSSPRSRSRNAWTRIKNVNGASRLSKFWNFFGAIKIISCRDR